MNYKIKDLVSKINEHIKKIEKQGDPNALEKLTQLQKLMIKKSLDSEVPFSGSPTIKNILDQYDNLINELSKYSLSIDKFKKLLDMHIKKIENDIKEQEKAGHKVFDYIIDPGMKDNNQLLEEFQDLNNLINSDPNIQTVFIYNNKPLHLQLERISREIGQGRDTYTQIKNELIYLIRNQLDTTNEITDSKNNDLLYLNSEFKSEVNQMDSTKGPLKITLQELEDIATIRINRLHNDLYGENGIQARILKMYKETMSQKFENKILPELKKREENSRKAARILLVPLHSSIIKDIENITGNRLSYSHLKALTKEEDSEFHTRLEKMLDIKDRREKVYNTWKNLLETVRQLKQENKPIEVIYDPGQPIKNQFKSLKQQIEMQLGKPLKEFSISNSPKTPGGGPDFR